MDHLAVSYAIHNSSARTYSLLILTTSQSATLSTTALPGHTASFTDHPRSQRCDMDPIQKLPLELVAQIAYYINAIDVWRLRTVSRAWNLALSAPTVVDHAVGPYATHRIEDAACKDTGGSTNDRILHFKALYTGLPYAIIDRPLIRSSRPLSDATHDSFVHAVLKGSHFAYTKNDHHSCVVNLVTGESRDIHFEQHIYYMHLAEGHLVVVDRLQDLHLVPLDIHEDAIIIKKRHDGDLVQKITSNRHFVAMIKETSDNEISLLNINNLDHWHVPLVHAGSRTWEEDWDPGRCLLLDDGYCYMISILRGLESGIADQYEMRIERHAISDIQYGSDFRDICYVNYTVPTDFTDAHAFVTEAEITSTGVANEWHVHYTDHLGQHRLLLYLREEDVSICLLSSPDSIDVVWKGIAYGRHGHDRDVPTYTIKASAIGARKTTSLKGVIDGRTSKVYHNKGLELLVNDSFMVDFTSMMHVDDYEPDFTVYTFDPALIKGSHQKLQQEPPGALVRQLVPADRQHEYLISGLAWSEGIVIAPPLIDVWSWHPDFRRLHVGGGIGHRQRPGDG